MRPSKVFYSSSEPVHAWSEDENFEFPLPSLEADGQEFCWARHVSSDSVSAFPGSWAPKERKRMLAMFMEVRPDPTGREDVAAHPAPPRSTSTRPQSAAKSLRSDVILA